MSFHEDFSVSGPSRSKWMVPEAYKFLPYSELTIVSPEASLRGSIWCLVFHIPTSLEDVVWIYLCRRDYGPPKNIKYTITTYNGNDIKEISRTQNFFGKNTNSEKIKLSKKGLARDVVIICSVNDAPPDEGAGELGTMSRAIQTEVENSVLEKEVPTEGELPSIEMKDVALLSERMKELLNKSSDYDITICVQDKKFRAHRSILSIRSPVFARMLSQDTKENNTSTIHIEDCDPESFDEFLLYVYSGKTENLSPSNALHLYYSADKYEFPVLMERCVSLLKTSLSVESVCDVVLLAAKHQEEELLKVATKFFARNMKKILKTVAWQKFMTQNPVEANELMIKSVDINQPDN